MRKALLLALLLPACVVGSDGQSPPGDDDDPGPGPGPTEPGISGNISADTTWDGVVVFSGATTIDPGVTVTVNAGATLNFGAASNLAVKGSLLVNGTAAAPVNIGPNPDAAQPSSFFGGFNVSGTLTMTYGVQRGGSIVTVAGGTATITDTKMFGATGDFLIMNGGTMNVTYSQIGADVGTTDTTHCNLHFGGSGNMITVTNSNIVGTPFGLMFYGGQLANFQNNNWDEEAAVAAADWIDSQPGVSGDFSGGFFSAGVPTAKAGATFTINNPSPTRLTNAGVGAPR
jgi:hypothetical protein